MKGQDEKEGRRDKGKGGGKEEIDTLVTAGREIKFRVLCLQLLSSISHNTH